MGKESKCRDATRLEERKGNRAAGGWEGVTGVFMLQPRGPEVECWGPENMKSHLLSHKTHNGHQLGK